MEQVYEKVYKNQILSDLKILRGSVTDPQVTGHTLSIPSEICVRHTNAIL